MLGKYCTMFAQLFISIRLSVPINSEEKSGKREVGNSQVCKIISKGTWTGKEKKEGRKLVKQTKKMTGAPSHKVNGGKQSLQISQSFQLF